MSTWIWNLTWEPDEEEAEGLCWWRHCEAMRWRGRVSAGWRRRARNGSNREHTRLEEAACHVLWLHLLVTWAQGSFVTQFCSWVLWKYWDEIDLGRNELGNSVFCIFILFLDFYCKRILKQIKYQKLTFASVFNIDNVSSIKFFLVTCPKLMFWL